MVWLGAESGRDRDSSAPARDYVISWMRGRGETTGEQREQGTLKGQGEREPLGSWGAGVDGYLNAKRLKLVEAR